MKQIEKYFARQQNISTYDLTEEASWNNVVVELNAEFDISIE